RCSGSLLNNNSGQVIPFFLTASHCISDDFTAQTVTAYWFYKTPSCNGVAPSTAVLPTTLGAQYVSGTFLPASDHTLLLLQSNPPSGTTYAGWTTDVPAIGANVTSLTHPHFANRRITIGPRGADYDIATYPDTITVRNWSVGIAEPGSSGGPVLNDA